MGEGVSGDTSKVALVDGEVSAPRSLCGSKHSSLLGTASHVTPTGWVLTPPPTAAPAPGERWAGWGRGLLNG